MQVGSTVYLPQNSKVFTASETREMQNNGNTGTINLNVVVNNPLKDRKEVTEWARLMQDELTKVLKIKTT
jgi:hypothetical protein